MFDGLELSVNDPIIVDPAELVAVVNTIVAVGSELSVLDRLVSSDVDVLTGLELRESVVVVALTEDELEPVILSVVDSELELVTVD